MFLLPSIVVGIVFSLLLGGRPARLLEVQFRLSWTVYAALGLQLVIFTRLGSALPESVSLALHVLSYALLFVFSAVNVRLRVLVPLVLGMAANAIAIVANGGRMPVSAGAWAAAGLSGSPDENVGSGSHLAFLGDVFALPSEVPFANVFSVGDLLIGFGVVALIVVVSSESGGERALVPARLARPLRSSGFRRLAAGSLVSHLGDWLTLAALVGWVFQATSSIGQVALLLLVRLAPPILGGTLAAAVVDRLSKGRLLVSVEVLRGITVAGALGAVLVGSRPLVFAAVAVSGGLAAISRATVQALVPSLLEPGNLPAGNALVGIAKDGAMALGALGAGAVLAAATAATALAVDLCTFAVATALFLGIRAEPVSLARGSGLGAGLRYLVGKRTLLTVVCAFGVATLATGLTNATLPRLLGGDSGLGPGAYGFGLGALAGGLVLGEILVGLTQVGPGGGKWIGAALFVMTGLFVLLALSHHVPTMLLILMLIGFVDGTTDVLFDTVVQREADPAFYGRVFGFASAFMWTTMMSAVATAPLLNRFVEPEEVLLVASAWLLAAGLVATTGTRRPAAGPVAAGVGSRS